MQLCSRIAAVWSRLWGRSWHHVLVISLFLIASSGALAPPTTWAATDPVRLYMATTGNDHHDGRSVEQAVRTLTRVHDLLMAMDPQRDVEVRIAPGTYYDQRVVWSFTMPHHHIRFMPLADATQPPVFDGCRAAQGPCAGGTWFQLRQATGQPSQLHFAYLRIRRYQTAISLNGDRNHATHSNGQNRIIGCSFEQIGNGFNTALEPSTAAVRLVNSDDNTIVHTDFVDVINTRNGGLIHAIYVAHMSDRNQIIGNRFLRSTGDPVRLRDFSNGTMIRDNRFIRVGIRAGYTDWYCDHEVRNDCTKSAPECPSWNNQFRHNVLRQAWDGRQLGTWYLYQDDTTRGCAPPSSTARRVRTSGNTSHDPARTWPLIRRGDQGEAVTTLQYLLRAHQHTIDVDGHFGPATEAAVQDFQAAAQLSVDGIVGSQTWQALIMTTRQGDTGDAVRAVQSQLSADGHALPTDGRFDPIMVQAVEAFQRTRGLTVDGIVGPQTWSTLVQS